MKGLKTILTVLCGVFCITNASAQMAIRADVGFVSVTGTTYDPISQSHLPGFGVQAGLEYDFRVKGLFYLTPGLYWSYRAAWNKEFGSGVTGKEILNEHFLNLPIYSKWKFDIKPDKFGIYVFCGPVFSAGLSSRSKINAFAMGYGNIEGSYDYYNGNISGEVGNFVGDEVYALKYTRFEFSLDAGVGFVFNRDHELVLGNSNSLTNRIKGEMSGQADMKYINLYIGYRYRFGNKE